MSSGRRSSVMARKDSTRLRIEKMEAERQDRRRAAQERKQSRAQDQQRSKEAGDPGDIDFIRLVRKWRTSHQEQAQSHEDSAQEQQRICICVRKRPISDRELQKNDHDSVSCLHPNVWVHSAKLRVDGISKYLDHNSFRFDHAFDEHATTDDVYRFSTMPLIDDVCSGTGVRATVFAYGQTGSGKTFTMEGIQALVSEDLFLLLSGQDEFASGCSFDNTTVTVAYFEIYGGYIQDLLNDRHRCKILEDGKGEIVVSGLQEFEAHDSKQFLSLLSSGNQTRTTHATEANDSSSRSHAICQIILRDKASGKLCGKLSLVDLAGSERGNDTKSHNSQRRTESAEINTSLLALKECIRALEDNKMGNKHVPYRASKLTLILKDCFTSALAKTTMIATVSPGASSADHTLNTLRYADRIKEQKVGDKPKSGGKPSGRLRHLERAKSASALVERPRAHSLPAQSHTHVDKSTEQKRAEQKQKMVGDDDEAELRRVVQSLFEQEENLLNFHMSTKIQENAELLTEEGKMLQNVQREGATQDDYDEYAARLGCILERKTMLIAMLEDRMASFRAQLKKEEELSKRVGNLSQY